MPLVSPRRSAVAVALALGLLATAAAPAAQASAGSAAPQASRPVILPKAQFAALKAGRVAVERALTAAFGTTRVEWGIRIAGDPASGLRTVPAIDLLENRHPSRADATCLGVLTLRECDAWPTAGGLVMSMESGLTILDDADGLRSASEVLTPAAQDAIRERADAQGSADPWVVYAESTPVGAYVQARYAPTALAETLLRAGVPPLARKGQTTRVERFAAGGGTTVYRFTQRVSGVALDGRTVRSVRAGYAIDETGALESATVWFDGAMVAEASFAPADPVTVPSPTVPSASIGFPAS